VIAHLVYILRWSWWRINAWSEIAAMAAALVVSLGLQWTGTFALFALGQMLFGLWPAGFALATPGVGGPPRPPQVWHS